MVTNPRRLLSQINPAFKVPLELATNQDFYYGSQYKPNDFQKMGLGDRCLRTRCCKRWAWPRHTRGPVTERKYAERDLRPDPVPGPGQPCGFDHTPTGKARAGSRRSTTSGCRCARSSPEDERKDIQFRRRQSLREDPRRGRQAEALRQFLASGVSGDSSRIVYDDQEVDKLETRSGSEQPGVDPGASRTRSRNAVARRTEATTVDGSESFPPPGMDLPDGSTVPLDRRMRDAPAAKK